MKQITFNVYDTAEFERLVQESTGCKDFDYLRMLDDDSPIFMDIRADSGGQIKEWFDNDLAQVQRWVNGENTNCKSIHTLMNWLCVNGFIQPGNYMIIPSW
jgi:hypothetical protein